MKRPRKIVIKVAILAAVCMLFVGLRSARAQATSQPAIKPPSLQPDASDIIAGPMLTWDTTTGDLHPWFMTKGGGSLWLYSGSATKSIAMKDISAESYPICGRATDMDVMTCRIKRQNYVECDGIQLTLVKYDPKKVKKLEDAVILGTATCPPIPSAGEPTQLTLAFGSCSHQEKFAESQPIWNAVVKEKPNIFLFIGDNIYAPSGASDYPDDKEKVRTIFRKLYAQNRQIPELQPLLRSAYCFGLWDDHDYGPNNSDSTFKHKDVALEVFREFFPGTYGLPCAPGCFQKITWGDVDVFMLDDRSFRDGNFDGGRKTMFGKAQLDWLKSGLKNSKAKVKLIVNGNQMLSDKHIYESWGGLFPKECGDFLRFIWDNKITGTIFLAGDRHFAELIRKPDPKGIGPDLYELTSSPLANGHFDRGGKEPNAERLAKYTDGVNFGLLKIDTTVTPLVVEMMVKDVDGTAVISERVVVK